MTTDTPQQFSAGIVGFGLAGRVFHAPLLQAAGFHIAGVVTRQHDAARTALPGAHILPDLGSLLALPGLDVVVIATPNDQHEAQALAALQAGKCVVVDKPLATNAAGAERLLAAGNTSRGSLTAFFNRRWDSDFLTLRQLLHSGSLGTLHTYEARWNRFRPEVVERWREAPESGGGLLLDLGSHLIDQALQLFGAPDWLQADLMYRRAGARVEDAFEIRMGIGALRIVLGSDMLVSDSAPRYRLHGASGSYLKHGLDVQEAQLRSGLSPLDTEFGIEPPEQRGTLITGATAAVQAIATARGRWPEFYSAVHAHLLSGTPLPVDAADACANLRLIEAARASAATGQRILVQR